MRKFVYICSRLRGDIEKNTEKARQYCRDAMLLYPEVVPIAPHIYFTQFFDDTDPTGRSIGMEAGLALLELCDEIWVFGVENLSEGMRNEIEYAKLHHLPILNGVKELARARRVAERDPREDRCVCCGEIIPEGRQVCPSCMKKAVERL